ncbi:hypothetical protein FRX31_012359, partial [Thalictrum thalictroides]
FSKVHKKYMSRGECRCIECFGHFEFFHGVTGKMDKPDHKGCNPCHMKNSALCNPLGNLEVENRGFV